MKRHHCHSFKICALALVLIAIAIPLAFTLLPGEYSNVAHSSDKTSTQSTYLICPNFGGAWRTIINIRNIDSRSLDVTLGPYGGEGAPLGAATTIENLEPGEMRSIDVQNLPNKTQSVKIETAGSLFCSAVFQQQTGRESDLVPTIQKRALELDFPIVASDYFDFKKNFLLNPNLSFANLEAIAINSEGYEIDRTVVPSISSMETIHISPEDIFNNITAQNASILKIISDQSIQGLQTTDYIHNIITNEVHANGESSLQTSSTSECKNLISGWKSECLRNHLRSKFNIASTDVSDPKLLQYVKANINGIATLLLQIDYGKDVSLYLSGSSNELSKEDILLNALSKGNQFNFVYVAIIKIISVWKDMPLLNVVGEAVNALGTIFKGIETYIKATDVLTAKEGRFVLGVYCNSRIGGTLPDTAYNSIYSDYTELVNLISNLKNIPPTALPGWFENAYAAYRLVGYSDSESIRSKMGKAIADLADPKLPGVVSVDPVSGDWKGSPQNVSVSSENANKIYYRITTTTDGSEPSEPTDPTTPSNDGSITGNSGQFPVKGTSGKLKIVRVKFRGHNDNGNGPVAGPFRYTIDLTGSSLDLKIAQLPMSGLPGTTFVEWGTGFTPNGTATLRFKKPDQSEYPPLLKQPLDNIGHFEITYKAPLNKPLGNYCWWAIDDQTKRESNPVCYQIIDGTGTVTGRLHENSASGKAISGAKVTWGGGQPATTKSDGSFELPKVPAGNQVITFSMTGYITYQRPVVVVPGQITYVGDRWLVLNTPDPTVNSPDLAVHALKIKKSSEGDSELGQTLHLQPGEQFDIKVTIKNRGKTKATKEFTVKYLLSGDSQIESSDMVIGVDTDKTDIGAGKTLSEWKQKIAAPSSPGTYYIGAWVNSPEDINKINDFSRGDGERGKIIVEIPNQQPEGSLESATCLTISGWARDPDTIVPIRVDLYADGPAGSGILLSEVTADILRPDLNFTDKNHGFSFQTPSILKNGQAREIYAYGVDSAGQYFPQLEGCPKSINCCELNILDTNFINGGAEKTTSPVLTLHLAGQDACKVNGYGVCSWWTGVDDVSWPINCEIWSPFGLLPPTIVNITPTTLYDAQLTSNVSWQGLSPTPILETGDKYCAYVWFRDVRENLNSAKDCIGYSSNLDLDGQLDAITCDTFTGWARDAKTADPIKVEIYVDGHADSGGIFVGEVLAELNRPDVPYAGKNHGFSFTVPSDLRDTFKHKYYAYAIDSAGGARSLLKACPQSIICGLSGN
jgi:hypothetical protein